MQKRIFAAVLVSLLVVVSLAAQQMEQHKMVQFQMALLKKGPKWNTTTEADRNSIFKEHLGNVISLLSSGKAIAAGPFGDDTDVAGLFIFRAASTEEAKTWVDADPAVKAGLFVVEMHPWSSEDIFKPAVMPMKMYTVYFGFLKRGPNRKEGDGNTPAVQELQKAHIANINRLAETKKLVVAGPFGDDGELRVVVEVPRGSTVKLVYEPKLTQGLHRFSVLTSARRSSGIR